MNRNNCNILVTGGAGYIGSHTVRLLVEAGYSPVVLDNLVFGHQEAVIDKEVTFIKGDIADKSLLEKIFAQFKFDAVMHFAAYAYVGESVQNPAKYYFNNVCAPLVLLDVMRKNDCNNFIFSSTCATYGNPVYTPIDEKHPQNPINPYGESKYMLEKILKDYGKAYDLRYVFLRYFNAAGASADAKIGEDHDPETHLIPLILDAAKGSRPHITVFGTDYDTPDGTCIRDYIHIVDLGRAHLKALNHLLQHGQSVICNLGTGKGASVKEVIRTAEEVTGLKIPVQYGERRPGDPPLLVADPSLAKEVLGWEAEYKDLKDIISTAWKWANGPLKGRFANMDKESVAK